MSQHPDVVKQGYRAARDVARRHAKSFYFASFALLGARRRAAFALYAFCRRLDDLVDGTLELDGGLARPGETAAPLEVEARLALARAAIAELYGERPATHGRSPGRLPWSEAELAALRDTVERFRIPQAPLQDLVSGMEMDLAPRRYATFAELDLYCYRVASTVGLMLTPVLGYSDERALEPAADLGRAMQLTNILRDIREDLARGRCYLPEDELAAFGLSIESLHRAEVDGRFVAFMRCQIARARAYYQRAAAGVPYRQGLGSQRMVRTMGAIYGGILDAIERQDYDVFRQRAYVPLSGKLRVGARVLLWPRSVLPLSDAPVAVPLLPKGSPV